jgi:hypothetical protein
VHTKFLQKVCSKPKCLVLRQIQFDKYQIRNNLEVLKLVHRMMTKIS